jgi:hypothetical protein
VCIAASLHRCIAALLHRCIAVLVLLYFVGSLANNLHLHLLDAWTHRDPGTAGSGTCWPNLQQALGPGCGNSIRGWVIALQTCFKHNYLTFSAAILLLKY